MGKLHALRLVSRRQKNLLAESRRHNFHQLDFGELFDILIDRGNPRGYNDGCTNRAAFLLD